MKANDANAGTISATIISGIANAFTKAAPEVTVSKIAAAPGLDT
jgi:hypothetical protein